MNEPLKLLTAVGLLALPMTMWGEATTGQWSYRECVDYARVNNISLKRSALTEQSASVSLESAKAQWTPSFDFGTTQGFTNTPWGEGSKNVYNSNYGVNAAWTLWDGGKRESDIRRASTDVQRSGWATDQEYKDIQTSILTTYLNILYAREAVEVNRSLYDVSVAQANRGKQMMESGKISMVDYQQLATQAESDRYNVVTAEAELATRRLALKTLLELEIDQNIDVLPLQFSREMVMDELPPLSESYLLALNTDSKLRYDSLSVKMADEDIRAAKAGAYPSLSVSAGVGTGYYSTGSQGWGEQMKRGFNENIGLTVSIPIYDRKKTKTAIAQAKISKMSSELDSQARRTEIAKSLEEYYIDHESAKSRYEAALESEREAALTDELVGERFSVGYVQITELLQSHQALVSARHEVLRAKYMAVLARKMVEFMRNGSVDL
ncbi:TolC family protein [uncultured Duncaniella sp.]|uniref:TolC family protein n=1 Tax=uncultured Duncaniella sp. TaxID=2768039 RepID=UPI0026752EB1|nr:TolC family protein [uncultured Duncaniella sp.]